MWLSLSKGFLSVVALKDEPNMVMVRARRKEHLTEYFAGQNVLYTKNADYPYRVICSKIALTAMVTRYIEQLDYTNFKDSVKNHQLHHAYLNVWSTMTGLEETPHNERRFPHWHAWDNNAFYNYTPPAQTTVPEPVGTLTKINKLRKWCSACDSYVTRHERNMVCDYHKCPGKSRR
jgi:hypothetical protein